MIKICNIINVIATEIIQQTFIVLYPSKRQLLDASLHLKFGEVFDIVLGASIHPPPDHLQFLQGDWWISAEIIIIQQRALQGTGLETGVTLRNQIVIEPLVNQPQLPIDGSISR